MNRSVSLTPRIALFASLIYVFSMATSFLPNINLLFFIVFVAGFMWGVIPGMLVGVFGMGLWAALNPFGPSIAPILIAQILGASLCGLIGALTPEINSEKKFSFVLKLALAGLLCTVLYYLPVNAVDAWMFKPFWPRFIMSWYWSLISVGANLIIFPLMFMTLQSFFAKERIKFRC